MMENLGIALALAGLAGVVGELGTLGATVSGRAEEYHHAQNPHLRVGSLSRACARAAATTLVAIWRRVVVLRCASRRRWSSTAARMAVCRTALDGTIRRRCHGAACSRLECDPVSEAQHVGAAGAAQMSQAQQRRRVDGLALTRREVRTALIDQVSKRG